MLVATIRKRTRKMKHLSKRIKSSISLSHNIYMWDTCTECRAIQNPFYTFTSQCCFKKQDYHTQKENMDKKQHNWNVVCCPSISLSSFLIMFNVLPNPNKRYRPTILTYFTEAQTSSKEFFNNLMPGPKGTESCCTEHLSWSLARPTRNMQLAHLTALSIQTSMDLH